MCKLQKRNNDNTKITIISKLRSLKKEEIEIKIK